MVKEVIYQKFNSVKDPYGWASNFYELKNGLLINGELWNGTEAYFQAMKFRGPNASKRRLEYSELFSKVDSPMKAKALGSQKPLTRFMANLVLNKKTDNRRINDLIEEYKDVKIRKDWNQVKLLIMVKAIIHKFIQYKNLRAKLVAIPDNMILVEHRVKDKIWGDGGDGGTGEIGFNALGKILTSTSWVLKYGSCEKTPRKIKKELEIDLGQFLKFK